MRSETGLSKALERRLGGERNFSPKTIKSYVSSLREYQDFYLGDAGNKGINFDSLIKTLLLAGFE